MYKIINGKIVAECLRNKILQLNKSLKKFDTIPGLAVIMLGNDPASSIYVSNKIKTCDLLGFNSELYHLSENTTESEILSLINKLNHRADIHGILVQLPLPTHIDKHLIQDAISIEKDVDAFNSANTIGLLRNNYNFLPCTPAGIMELFKFYNIPLDGKQCVILGRSDIVGKPLAMLMLNANATVTICHSHSQHLVEICQTADILVSAVGSKNIISAEAVKPKAIVIDVGINRDKDGKLFGDVDFKNVAPKSSYITPVPGGVGPMTIAMLMKNTILAAAKSIRIDLPWENI